MVAGALPLLSSHEVDVKAAHISASALRHTRPDWNGPRNFMGSIREAAVVGYHWIETFWEYVIPSTNRRWELKNILSNLNLKPEMVSNRDIVAQFPAVGAQTKLTNCHREIDRMPTIAQRRRHDHQTVPAKRAETQGIAENKGD